jgi:MFS family permease
VPALVLLSAATAFWQVVFWTACLWFCAGLCLAVASVYTGVLSEEEHRGRSFSMMALSTPFSLLLGGLSIGSLASMLGFSSTFLVLAALWSTLPCAFAFILPDVPVGEQNSAVSVLGGRRTPAWGFPLLLTGALLSAAAVSIGQIGTSLSMQNLAFLPTAVGSTTTAAGLAMIPLVLLMGKLSDRLGRGRFLILGYLVSAAGALALSAANTLWHFWAAMALLRAGQAVNEAIAPAVATDILPPPAWSRGLPRLKSVNWLAAMLSFSGAGYAIELLGVGPIFIIAAGMALGAATLLMLLPIRKPQAASSATPTSPKIAQAQAGEPGSLS